MDPNEITGILNSGRGRPARRPSQGGCDIAAGQHNVLLADSQVPRGPEPRTQAAAGLEAGNREEHILLRGPRMAGSLGGPVRGFSPTYWKITNTLVLLQSLSLGWFVWKPKKMNAVNLG